MELHSVNNPLVANPPLGNLSELLQFDLCYLASPYSAYPHGYDRAYSDIGEISWWLKLAGVSHFSPVIYSHPLATVWGVEREDSKFWMEFDKSMMMVCDALVIVELDGWSDSAGIAIEEAIFAGEGKPVFRLNPATLEVVREGN